jgi:septal ring factor EnvC (AmiA/AmiB activator)
MNTDLIHISTNIIAFVAAAFGALRWYNKYQKSVFAQERDIAHLKRQSQQVSSQLVETDKKLDDLTAAVIETRGAIGIIIKDFGVTNRAVNLPTFGKTEEGKGGKSYG